MKQLTTLFNLLGYGTVTGAFTYLYHVSPEPLYLIAATVLVFYLDKPGFRRLANSQVFGFGSPNLEGPIIRPPVPYVQVRPTQAMVTSCPVDMSTHCKPFPKRRVCPLDNSVSCPSIGCEVPHCRYYRDGKPMQLPSGPVPIPPPNKHE